MAPKNFRAMAQTHIFGGFEPWLEPTFDIQILTSKWLSKLKKWENLILLEPYCGGILKSGWVMGGLLSKINKILM